MVNYQKQGQFSNLLVLKILKLSLKVKLDQDLPELIKVKDKVSVVWNIFWNWINSAKSWSNIIFRDSFVIIKMSKLQTEKIVAVDTFSQCLQFFGTLRLNMWIREQFTDRNAFYPKIFKSQFKPLMDNFVSITYILN